MAKITRQELAFDPASKDVATPSEDGLMASGDKAKLDGIEAGVRQYMHPSGDGNLHVPATGTSSEGKVLKAGASAGSPTWGSVNISEVSNLQSTLDSMQGFKLTQSNGTAKIPTNTNLDVIVAPGSYRIPRNSGYANIPFNSADFAILEVAAVDTTGYILQRFTNFENDWSGKTYTRFLPNVGGWSAWKQTLQQGDAQMYRLVQDGGQSSSGISDFNLATYAGHFYVTSGRPNAPLAGTATVAWFMQVYVHPSDGSLTQVAQSTSTPVLTYTRRKSSAGVWSSWNPSYSQDDVQIGSVTISPSAANTPTGLTLTFPAPFKKDPTVMLTPNTTVPGSTVTGVGVTGISKTGCTIWVTRTNTSATGVQWLAIDAG